MEQNFSEKACTDVRTQPDTPLRSCKNKCTSRQLFVEFTRHDLWGRLAALARSHMHGSLSFKRAMEQTKEAMPLTPKTIATAALGDQ